MKGNAKILEQLKSKEARLNKILLTPEPNDQSKALHQAHVRRLANAATFLDELSSVSVVLDISKNVQLVTLHTLQRQSEKADFCTIDFDGEFCKLVLIQNFPYDDLWLLYVSPVESI